MAKEEFEWCKVQKKGLMVWWKVNTIMSVLLCSDLPLIKLKHLNFGLFYCYFLYFMEPLPCLSRYCLNNKNSTFLENLFFLFHEMLFSFILVLKQVEFIFVEMLLVLHHWLQSWLRFFFNIFDWYFINKGLWFCVKLE